MIGTRIEGYPAPAARGSQADGARAARRARSADSRSASTCRVELVAGAGVLDDDVARARFSVRSAAVRRSSARVAGRETAVADHEVRATAPSGASTRTMRSNARSSPASKSSGMSQTTSVGAVASRVDDAARRSRSTSGWTIASSARAPAGRRRRCARSAPRSSAPSGVRMRGTPPRDDRRERGGTGRHGLAGEEVGVDDHGAVRREPLGHRPLAGGDVSGQCDDEHGDGRVARGGP